MKIKVTKRGNVQVTGIRGGRKTTLEYDFAELLHRHWPGEDTPHWPYHMAEKNWVTDVNAILDAQAKVMAMFPNKFDWVRPDWRYVTMRRIEKMKKESVLFDEELCAVLAEKGVPWTGLYTVADMLEADRRLSEKRGRS